VDKSPPRADTGIGRIWIIRAVHLRGYAATVDTILRSRVCSLVSGRHPLKCEGGLPSVARAKRERRMVAQIFTSWNPLMGWVQQIAGYQGAA